MFLSPAFEHTDLVEDYRLCSCRAGSSRDSFGSPTVASDSGALAEADQNEQVCATTEKNCLKT